MTVAEFSTIFSHVLGSLPLWPFVLAAAAVGLTLLPAAYWAMIGVIAVTRTVTGIAAAIAGTVVGGVAGAATFVGITGWFLILGLRRNG